MSLPPTLPPRPNLNKLPPPLNSYRANQGNNQLLLLTEPNVVSASIGVNWLTDAWQIFRGNMGLWIGASVFYIVMMIIPILGYIAQLLMAFFIAGVSYMAHKEVMGQPVDFGDVFIGFQKNTVQLFILILLNLVMLIICVVVLFILFRLLGVSSYDVVTTSKIPMSFWLVCLVGMLIFIPYAMALWLAPTLIILHNMRAIDAIRLSLKACIKNIGAFFVFGLVGFLMLIAAIIPLGLGLFFAVPVLMLTYYTSYRSMLTNQPLS